LKERERREEKDGSDGRFFLNVIGMRRRRRSGWSSSGSEQFSQFGRP